MMILAAAGASCLLLSGCFGYGMGYGRYRNQVPKTTAARETLEEFDINDLRRGPGDSFQYKDLAWGSTAERVEEVLGTSIGTTNAFADGGGYGDINISIKLADFISVGVMPVFDTKGLSMLTFYFEDVYTAEQLDDLYGRLQEICTGAFGEPEKITPETRETNGVTFRTETTFWYAPVSDTQVTSLQIGKTDTGRGTNAVVIGVNSYNPEELEEESTGEDGSEAEDTEAPAESSAELSTGS